MLVRQQTWLGLVGGVFLCYLGLKTLLSQPVERATSESKGGLLGAYASTFLLTLTNPMTILSFTFAFAALGGGNEGDYVGASLLVLGVFAGSGLWWLFLSGAVNLFRARFDLKWVNRISGTVITGLGLVALWGLMG
jgi:threonine/homoserine/homoserine lactone efflux protein